MDEEDLKSVIAYLRTLEPAASEKDTSYSDFPMSLIINTMPKEAELQAKPEASDKVAYGKYLVQISVCNDCHTNYEGGTQVGEYMAGGRRFNLPDGSYNLTPNITPHDETGIGRWSEEEFVSKFKSFSDSTYTPPVINKGDYQSYLPWNEYSGITEEDLKAIYAYLRSIPAVENKVEKFNPASD